MFEKTPKLLFSLTCFFPIVSAKLPLPDMFNFGIKEYTPYIIVTAILLIAFIPIGQLKALRTLISLILGFFTVFIFPPIFFYVRQGFDDFTIILIAFNCSVIACGIITLLIYTKEGPTGIFIVVSMALIVSVFPPLFSYSLDGFSKLTIVVSACTWTVTATIIITYLTPDKIKAEVLVTLIALIFIVFPPLFIYATESFSNEAITFLILFEILNFTFFLFFCIPKYHAFYMIVFVLVMIAIFVYGLIITIEHAGHYYFIIVIVNLILGCCFSYLSGTLMGNILRYILGGIDFYIVFYELQNQIDPISLLLFWSDLWTTLFVIYTAIETYICNGGKVDDRDIDFNLQNYFS